MHITSEVLSEDKNEIVSQSLRKSFRLPVVFPLDALCPVSFISALFRILFLCLSYLFFFFLISPSSSCPLNSSHFFPHFFSLPLLNVCRKVTTHLHMYVQTDEQSRRDRRLLMTDTRLILSGTNGVKSRPQREWDRTCAGEWRAGSAVLSSCHSCTVYLSVSFFLRFLILPLHHLCLLLREKRLTTGLICDQGLQGKRSIYLQDVIL